MTDLIYTSINDPDFRLKLQVDLTNEETNLFTVMGIDDNEGLAEKLGIWFLGKVAFRQDFIDFAVTNDLRLIAVTQEGTEVWRSGGDEPIVIVLEIDPTSISLPAVTDNDWPIQLQTNSTELVTVKSKSDWISVTIAGDVAQITVENNPLEGVRDGSVVFEVEGVEATLAVRQAAAVFNFVIAANAEITLAEATNQRWVESQNRNYYTIPDGAVITEPIVCTDVIKKDGNILVNDITINYSGAGASGSYRVTNVRALKLAVNYSGSEQLNLSYVNCQVQNLSSSGFYSETVNDCHPLDPDTDSSSISSVAQRYAITSVDYKTLELDFTGTVASTIQVQNSEGDTVISKGAGTNVLYQHSVTSAHYKNVELYDQNLSSLSITGVSWGEIRSVVLDNVTFLVTTVGETLVNNILAYEGELDLTLTFRNGSTQPTAEQIQDLEDKGVIVNIE